MRGSFSRVWMLVAVAGLALPVAGQVARSRTSAPAETHVRAAKTPYTAEYKITHVQALADGTTITRETTEVKALDSQGRRMLATTIVSGPEARGTHVLVYDPAARTQTTWHSPGKVAHVFKMSSAETEHSCSITMHDSEPLASGPKSKTTSESLGTTSMQGVEARGRRYSTTIPAGAEGNDAPLVSTSERWTALAIGLDGLMVRDVDDNPQRGRTTRELTNLIQGEPDPATFQPPDGYEIVTKESSGCLGETSAGAAGEGVSGAKARTATTTTTKPE